MAPIKKVAGILIKVNGIGAVSGTTHFPKREAIEGHDRPVFEVEFMVAPGGGPE
jgi:hypothetical protein